MRLCGYSVIQIDDGFFGQRIGASQSVMVATCLIGTCMRRFPLAARSLWSCERLSVWEMMFLPFVFTPGILSIELLVANTADAV
jgi:hypothetical protein